MVTVPDSVRSASPGLAAWIANSLPQLADDTTIWPAFRVSTQMTDARARDAISGGFSSPVLALGDLGNKDTAFDPSLPKQIWLSKKLAAAFEAMPTNQRAQVLMGAALLAEIVIWNAARNGRGDGKASAISFLNAAYSTPPDRTWLPIAQDDGRFTIVLQPSDLDDLVRITTAEAGGEPREGRAGVIFVVLNRVASTVFQNSVRAVIDASGQFEPVSKTASKSVVGLPMPPTNLRDDLLSIIEEIASGTLTDPTNSATFFQNAATTQQRGTQFNVGMKPVAEIGRHSFYDRFGSNPQVKVPPWRITTPTSRATGAPASPSAGVII